MKVVTIGNPNISKTIEPVLEKERGITITSPTTLDYNEGSISKCIDKMIINKRYEVENEYLDGRANRRERRKQQRKDKL